MRADNGVPEHIRAFTNDLVRLRIDLLLAGGPELALRAAKEATMTVPTVMVAVDFDPVALDYVTSLAHPGGNITGIFFQQLELTAKRLELVKEVLPLAARALRLNLQPLELRNPPYDFEGALRDASQNRTEALLVLGSSQMFRERARIGELATRSRIFRRCFRSGNA